VCKAAAVWAYACPKLGLHAAAWHGWDLAAALAPTRMAPFAHQALGAALSSLLEQSQFLLVKPFSVPVDPPRRL
jgi:hypothetical protein